MATSVLICSAPHSGSTLLARLLGSHSRVAAVGEASQLPKNIALDTTCSCGQPMRSCRTWVAVADRIREDHGIDWFASPYRFAFGYPKTGWSSGGRPRARYLSGRAWGVRFTYVMRRQPLLALVYLRHRFGLDVLSALTRPFERTMANSLSLSDYVGRTLGVDMVADSSKSYLRAVSLYRTAPEKARLIFLTRDGRAVLYSDLKRQWSLKAGVWRWTSYHRRAMPLFDRRVSAAHLLHVRYEDLVDDPSAELRRICRFLGLAYEPAMRDHASHEHHICNGSKVRFAPTSEIRHDRSWQTSLSPDELRYFEAQAGALNAQLGYGGLEPERPSGGPIDEAA